MTNTHEVSINNYYLKIAFTNILCEIILKNWVSICKINTNNNKKEIEW